jgi:tRNA nucleotidyltransferase (CCA-adding enzyme)
VKAYVVGGAVRDELLGLPVQDRDHVVVGATPEEMVAQGYQPVGKDFPVFLHPKTHEEYALARTERKSGRGYKGFVVHAAPDVTLEDDLRRRDLTINAIAKDPESGELIDPFRGREDLQKRILRHVSEAFAEDPVRILRVARFAARFGFDVAPETKALMRQMVASGEADYLVPERVWQEFAKGLGEKQPERMLAVLEDAGLRAKLLPGIDMDARFQGSLPVRFTLLTWKLEEKAVEELSEKLKAPNEVRELAGVAARVRNVLNERSPSPDALLALLKRADAFRRPERFEELLEAARIAIPGFAGERIDAARRAALAVDAAAIARANPPERVARAIDEARLAAIARAP